MKFYLDFIIVFVFINSLLHAKALRIRRNTLRDESLRWPKAIVPYTINEAFSSSDRQLILKAMKDIESVSCIRFKRHSGGRGYVDIVKGDSICIANIGYSGRRRKITLGPDCVWYGGVLHELFHMLGFNHEHTRPDRDQYITLNIRNIKPKHSYNFKKLSSEKFTSLGLPYDFKSVLHYSDKAFAIKDSHKTIKPIRGPPVIRKATRMSKLDVLKLNRLYRCVKRKHGGNFERRMS